MLSSTLLRASRSTKTRRLVERLPPTRRVVDRFVAGENADGAVRATRQLQAANLRVTIDVLGEDVTDLADARTIRDHYMQLLWALHEAGCSPTTDVSLKLSALGQHVTDRGEDIAMTHAYEICVAANAVGCTVTLDMEDHTTVDFALHAGNTLRADFPTTGTVLQSNLLRTPSDVADLATTATRIRLVKGAYREPASVAHQNKTDVDAHYRTDLDALMRSRCYPMVATHDPAMLRHAVAAAKDNGRRPQQWEAQMLYGIRTDLQAALTDDGNQVRVYVPYGTDWYGYFMRRLAERPANVAFFLRALTRR